MELASALKKGKKIEEVVVVGMEDVPFERVLGPKVRACASADKHVFSIYIACHIYVILSCCIV